MRARAHNHTRTRTQSHTHTYPFPPKDSVYRSVPWSEGEGTLGADWERDFGTNFGVGVGEREDGGKAAVDEGNAPALAATTEQSMRVSFVVDEDECTYVCSCVYEWVCE